MQLKVLVDSINYEVVLDKKEIEMEEAISMDYHTANLSPNRLKPVEVSRIIGRRDLKDCVIGGQNDCRFYIIHAYSIGPGYTYSAAAENQIDQSLMICIQKTFVGKVEL